MRSRSLLSAAAWAAAWAVPGLSGAKSLAGFGQGVARGALTNAATQGIGDALSCKRWRHATSASVLA
jgi:hypothetical protein